jgi:hypothetical protein
VGKYILYGGLYFLWIAISFRKSMDEWPLTTRGRMMERQRFYPLVKISKIATF